MSGIRRLVAFCSSSVPAIPSPVFGVGSGGNPSSKPQDVARCFALVGARIIAANPVDQAQLLQPGEMVVQR